MRLTEINLQNARPVDGYGPGFFRIAGVVHDGATLVLPSGTARWAGVHDVAPFLDSEGQIDVLFVGTGPEITPIPTAFRQALDAVGIGVEIMNSPAACRTYNLCLAEGRRVAIAVLPV